MNFLTDETVDTDEYMCHQTRPVLLPTGWADIPYPWHPSVVDIGIYQIGNFYILSGWFSIDRSNMVTRWRCFTLQNVHFSRSNQPYFENQLKYPVNSQQWLEDFSETIWEKLFVCTNQILIQSLQLQVFQIFILIISPLQKSMMLSLGLNSLCFHIITLQNYNVTK